MASAEDLANVRANTDTKSTDTGFDDVTVGALIDVNGVVGATTEIWRRKVAQFSDKVSISEGGASRSLSDLAKNGMTILEYWEKKLALDSKVTQPTSTVTRVTKIVRS